MRDERCELYLLVLPAAVIALWLREVFDGLSQGDRTLVAASLITFAAIPLVFAAYYRSRRQKANRARKKAIRELPAILVNPNPAAVFLGDEINLRCRLYLPDGVRLRHVHVLGSTGSGKTESVILNFLRQDVRRGIGSIVLDAKGDASFLDILRTFVTEESLHVFDLGREGGGSYDPLEHGSPLESAQRLFASFTWSEEYYKSKALAALQTIFQRHFEIHGRNPRLRDLVSYLQSAEDFGAFALPDSTSKAAALKEYQDLSGLRDQLGSLTIGPLANQLSPSNEHGLQLAEAANGAVLYFRLQSLMSPQLVAIIGRLLVNHLNYISGSSHRSSNRNRAFIPVYFDEFAAFACPEFADLIAKARSAGFALHFSHQSIGDLVGAADGFLNRITDNAATKIVLRINDPDTADYFARSFGTRMYHKATHRVTNAKNIDSAEVLEEGTIREAHQFRASPDLLKTLPTGSGAVLIAHGMTTPHGGSSVFTVEFPPLLLPHEAPRT